MDPCDSDAAYRRAVHSEKLLKKAIKNKSEALILFPFGSVLSASKVLRRCAVQCCAVLQVKGTENR